MRCAEVDGSSLSDGQRRVLNLYEILRTNTSGFFARQIAPKSDFDWGVLVSQTLATRYEAIQPHLDLS